MKTWKILTALALAALTAPGFGGGPFSIKTTCSTMPNSVGQGAYLRLEGVVAHHPDVACVRGGPGLEFGLLLYGPAPADPPLPWGNGQLCIWPFHPGNGRFPVAIFDVQGSVDVPLTDPNDPTNFPFVPGETGYFQYTYRDHHEWNLSNALRVDFAP